MAGTPSKLADHLHFFFNFFQPRAGSPAPRAPAIHNASNVSNPSPQEVSIDNALVPSVKECAYLGHWLSRVGRSMYFLIWLRVFHEVGTCGKDRSEQKDTVYHRPNAGFLP